MNNQDSLSFNQKKDFSVTPPEADIKAEFIPKAFIKLEFEKPLTISEQLYLQQSYQAAFPDQIDPTEQIFMEPGLEPSVYSLNAQVKLSSHFDQIDQKTLYPLPDEEVAKELDNAVSSIIFYADLGSSPSAIHEPLTNQSRATSFADQPSGRDLTADLQSLAEQDAQIGHYQAASESLKLLTRESLSELEEIVSGL